MLLQYYYYYYYYLLLLLLLNDVICSNAMEKDFLRIVSELASGFSILVPAPKVKVK